MANYITANDANGNLQNFLVADYLALYPSAIIKTPSSNFTFTWNWVITDFYFNQPVVVTADQFAAMQAAGCPIA